MCGFYLKHDGRHAGYNYQEDVNFFRGLIVGLFFSAVVWVSFVAFIAVIWPHPAPSSRAEQGRVAWEQRQP